MAKKYTTAGELLVFGLWALGMVLGYGVMKLTGWYGVAGGMVQVGIPGALFALVGHLIALEHCKPSE